MGVRGAWIALTVLMAGMVCADVQAEPRHHRRHKARAESQTVQADKSNEGAQAVEDAAIPDDVPDVHPGPVRLIVIDPGHGGTNEGAFGVAKIHEKHLTLMVAIMLADRLRKALPDTEIILTRQRDSSMYLNERIGIANNLNADLFLSLHFNFSNNLDAIGFESFWAGDFWEADYRRDGIEITEEVRAEHLRTGALSAKMAHCFNRAMRHRFDVLDRGVRTGDFTVLTQSHVPSVVLEMGFLSNADEGISLVTPEHRAKLVDALVEAVVQYTKL